jgi:tRNA-uridine 2-sulfurtransferase
MYSQQMSLLNTNHRRAVALYSGGLDSILAIYLMQRQGIDIIPLHFTSPFAPLDPRTDDSPIRGCARQLGLQVHFLEKDDEFYELIRNPVHGHGKNMNPCIDCRIYTLKKAKEYMAQVEASFMVTGEVVGQRPMSQGRNTMRMIEKKAGCDGIIVRPLSARILPTTIAEQEGLINRDELLGIGGRGRKVQLKLAREINLRNFAPPAGGCLLTDKMFSKRVRDLFQAQKHITNDDISLLHVGRHIRFRPDLKIIVGRIESENERIFELRDGRIIFTSDDFPAPTILCTGIPTSEEQEQIAAILLHYSKKIYQDRPVLMHDARENIVAVHSPNAIDEEWLREHTI